MSFNSLALSLRMKFLPQQGSHGGQASQSLKPRRAGRSSTQGGRAALETRQTRAQRRQCQEFIQDGYVSSADEQSSGQCCQGPLSYASHAFACAPPPATRMRPTWKDCPDLQALVVRAPEDQMLCCAGLSARHVQQQDCLRECGPGSVHPHPHEPDC